MTSVENPGLVCLPTHRSVKAERQLRTSALRNALKPFFTVKHVPAPDPTALEAAYTAGRGAQQPIGCYLPKNRLYVLEPDLASGLRKRFPEDADCWWRLPVSLLHYVLLPDLLGILPGSLEESTLVEYTHVTMDVCLGVARGAYSAGFLLPAIDPHEVLAVAMRGKRLPPKSTFFYPKVLSGLALHMF
jgi:uncharacterized protein (DUF1015 family)